MPETTIAKVDADRRLVFGWASVAKLADGSDVVDAEGDVISPDDLETAAYDFVLKFREANTMHDGPSTARLVESFVSTPDKLVKMGLPADALPSALWVGFKVDDDAAWEGIKSGAYSAFSIEGRGTRVAV